MGEHWTERADRVTGGSWRILGEDECGDLWVPTSREKWSKRFNGRNPAHWRFWLRSRMTSRIAFLEMP